MTRVAALSLVRLPIAMSLAQATVFLLILLAIPAVAFAQDAAIPFATGLAHPPGGLDPMLALIVIAVPGAALVPG